MNEVERCIIVGASHAGVQLAFALRTAGWNGDIVLYDRDPLLPYQRPPLSKTALSGEGTMKLMPLKPEQAYTKAEIDLRLGCSVCAVNTAEQSVTDDGGRKTYYSHLVLATGARAIVPPIQGSERAKNLFTLRDGQDVNRIRQTFNPLQSSRVVIIGAGYIGLETAASLKKMGAEVTVLEREPRVLARVTSPEMSAFFTELHRNHGVHIACSKNVTAINEREGVQQVCCADGSAYTADMIIVGVGVHVRQELAKQCGLRVHNGVVTDSQCRSSVPNIFAIGDCSLHPNAQYQRFVRLESVQNAVDQAKVVAETLAGRCARYEAIPWFWSDQYDIKLQIVGLADGYDRVFFRDESEGNTPSFSYWYFRGMQLLAVDAVNNAKAYVVGTKLLKSNAEVNLSRLQDLNTSLSLDALIAS